MRFANPPYALTENRDDVSMPDSIAQQVRREHGEDVLTAFKRVFKFDQPAA